MQVSCAANSWSPTQSMAASSCTCDDGFYGPQGGPCTECEPGSWCWGGQKSACQLFSMSAAGATYAKACTCIDGFFFNEFDQCHMCKADTWCANGDATACPENSRSGDGSSAETDCLCLAGFEGPDGGTPQPMLPGSRFRGGCVLP